MKEFSTKQWNKTTLDLFLKHTKEHCVIARKCKWQQRPRTGLQPHSKIMIRNHITDVALCQECGFQSHRTM